MAKEFPVLCGRDGKPLTWRHFIYGLEVHWRLEARRRLAIATAIRIATTADEDAAEKWFEMQEILAGYR